MAPHKKNDHYLSIQRVMWVSIIVDAVLSALKIVVGAVGQSTALLADGFHSLSDLISSLIVMIGFHVAFKPADASHPYGHGRAESMAGWMVAVLLFALGAGTAVKAIRGLTSSNPLAQPRHIALWVVILSIVVKEALFRYKIRLGRKIQSQSLIADAWHHRSDAISSVVALIGIAGAIIGGTKWRFLDQAAAIAVALIIIQVALKVFRESSGELMDTMPAGETIEQLKNLASNVNEVAGIEKVVARKSGLDLLIDIHIEVDPKMTVEKSHCIAQTVRDKIMQTMPNVKNVLVHIEPYYPNDH